MYRAVRLFEWRALMRRSSCQGDTRPSSVARGLDQIVAGKPVADIAVQLGVTAQTVYNWRNQDLIDRGNRVEFPAESVRTFARRRTVDFSSPGWWPTAVSAGSWAIAASSTVIGQRARSGAPRTQHASECFAGRVRGAEPRMESEPALVVRDRPGLVLRMNLHQRRVDVQHHPIAVSVGAAIRRPTSPRVAAACTERSANTLGVIARIVR